MRQRVAAKVAELGIGASTLWYRLQKWRAAGSTTFGLVDRRLTTARLSHPLAGADPRIIAAITAQHGIEVDESTGDMNRFKRRVQNRLDAEHGKGEVPLPEMTTFRRWNEAILPGKHTTGSAVTRRTTGNRPEDSYEAVTASRVGEVVMLDTTPLDAPATALRAVPAGPDDEEEFDIDFETIPCYEVWGAKPARRPDDGTPQ